MAEFKVDNQVNVGWGLSLQMAGKTPAIAKRIFDTYANAKAFVDSTTDTALPGILVSVIRDTDENNGLYYVTKAAGFDGVGAGAGELVKVGEGSGVINVETFAEAQDIATADTIGQLVYLTAEDTETTPDTTYTVGLYVVTGAGTLAKLGTSSAGGEDLSGDVATLKGKVSSLETSTSEHYANNTIHLPGTIGTDGQILSVSEGAPKWVDKDPAYTLPVAGAELGGVKEGGDIDIDESGIMTVNAAKLATKAVVSLGGKVGAITLKATSATDGDVNLSISDANELSATISGIGNFSKNGHTHEIANVSGLQDALDAKVSTSQLGVASGVATLDANGHVPSAQLPSYVDDVIEAENYASLPETGETGKIYVTLDDNKTYRWSGSAYVEISASLALGETASTAFAGNRGKALEEQVSAINTSISNITVKSGNGIEITDNSGKVVSVKLDANNESAFLTLSADGLKLSGVQTAIDSAKTAAITASQNLTVNGKKLVDNTVPLVLIADDILMTGYSGTIAEASDTLNEGIAKLASAIQDATSKADVVSLNGKTGTVTVTSTAPGQIEVNGTEEGASVVSINGWDSKADQATIDAYRINGKALGTDTVLGGADIALTDYVIGTEALPIAADDTVNAAIGKLEKSLTDNESVVSESINKIKTAVGLSEALAYEAPADSNYLEGATSVKDATAKLDAAIKENANNIDLNKTEALSQKEIEGVCTL